MAKRAAEVRETPGRVPFDSAKLDALMERERIDLILVSSRHNTRYLTGGYYN